MSNDELINLINKSFLKNDVKNSLVEQLSREGETKEFYNNFNKLVIEEFNTRANKFRNGVNEFNKEVVEVDEEHKKEQTDLEAKLSTNLSNIESNDIKEKNRIWDEHYTQMEKLEKNYKSNIKGLIDKVVIKSLNNNQ